MSNLEQTFKSIVSGVNFMTPDVVDYFQRGIFVVELSTCSEKFCGSYAFGVTVANMQEGKREIDLGKSFTHPNKEIAKRYAMEYIDSLA